MDPPYVVFRAGMRVFIRDCAPMPVGSMDAVEKQLQVDCLEHATRLVSMEAALVAAIAAGNDAAFE